MVLATVWQDDASSNSVVQYTKEGETFVWGAAVRDGLVAIPSSACVTVGYEPGAAP